jgi:pSer/pThr/pTyr-binding forkhead associated (FHA) protein
MGEGPTIPLDRPIVLIGRHPDCDVRIDSHKISRRHCCLVQTEDKLVLRDLGSTNGIYWNGQRVEEAILAPDDEVQIGHLHYQVVTKDAPCDVRPLKNGETKPSTERNAADPPSSAPAGAPGSPVDAAARPAREA